MPYPRNIETAAAVEAAVREAGAIPATIAILGGRLKVGLSRDEIQHIGKRGAGIIKCSRRDLPFVVAGFRNRRHRRRAPRRRRHDGRIG
jgi:pseudouridine-5'-phosphate glycosidase